MGDNFLPRGICDNFLQIHLESIREFVHVRHLEVVWGVCCGIHNEVSVSWWTVGSSI
jgi:hypothetical protein